MQPSRSPWASPIVLVPKKNRNLWFHIDYLWLKSATHKDVHPLLRVDGIWSSPGKIQYFSSLDLASRYWQVVLDKETQIKSSFSIFKGLYEFIRMPFV